MATAHDQFIDKEVAAMLRPGEQVRYKAYMVQQPGLIWQLLLVGGLLLFLMTKAYYVVVTNSRLIVIRTKQGFFKPSLVNIGVEETPLANIRDVATGGIANNRSMTFHKADGSKVTYRIAPWSKLVTGQKLMLEEFPSKLKQGLLAAG